MSTRRQSHLIELEGEHFPTFLCQNWNILFGEICELSVACSQGIFILYFSIIICPVHSVAIELLDLNFSSSAKASCRIQYHCDDAGHSQYIWNSHTVVRPLLGISADTVLEVLKKVDFMNSNSSQSHLDIYYLVQ